MKKIFTIPGDKDFETIIITVEVRTRKNVIVEKEVSNKFAALLNKALTPGVQKPIIDIIRALSDNTDFTILIDCQSRKCRIRKIVELFQNKDLFYGDKKFKLVLKTNQKPKYWISCYKIVGLA